MADTVNLNAARAERAGDNRLWTASDCLRDLIARIDRGQVHIDKMLILHADCREDAFNVGYSASNLNASSGIALVEVAKTLMLQDMNYLPKVDK